jgi:hypothetical protein
MMYAPGSARERSGGLNVFGLSMYVRRDPSSGEGYVLFETADPVEGPYNDHQILLTLPGTDLNFPQDLSGVQINPPKGVYVTGRAQATGDGPILASASGFGCPGASTATAILDRDAGYFHGNLTADFLLGGAKKLSPRVPAALYEEVMPTAAVP